MTKAMNELEEWVKRNRDITIDRLSLEDAKALDAFAENQTMSFIHLIAGGLKLRSQQTRKPLPSTKKQLIQSCLVIRVMIMIVKEQYADLPSVPMFEVPGKELLESMAFRSWSAMHGAKTGWA